MKKILSVVGTRPNFIKIAPIHKAVQKYHNIIQHKICHTGQHFDSSMSQVFFNELDLQNPDFFLGINGGTQAVQTARIMMEFEKVLTNENPDLVIVPGDVTSTLACSLVASKLGVPIAHIESGLRSFDRDMPEEINRIVTDVLADYLFVSEQSGIENLKKEGIHSDKMFFVGNVMIDSLMRYLPYINKSKIVDKYLLVPGKYIVTTFHRPSNVDIEENLKNILKLLNSLGKYGKVIFPVHPRTEENIKKWGLDNLIDNSLILLSPIGYIDFIALIKQAGLVLTDSGGIQEETTFLGVQCLTVRNNTERPVTVQVGTNQLIGTDLDKVREESIKILDGQKKSGGIPELWDGKTSERIIEVIIDKLKIQRI
jgi:UDP-N-acetylglucosamine 2-epimerase (non-hydrolysing)